jgi:hypothetical protein
VKHLRSVSIRPKQASQDPTLGQILTVLAGILGVLAQTLGGKESSAS